MDKVDKSLLGAGAREQLRESLAEMGGLRHFPPDSSKRKYLRLRLDEAIRLRDEIDAVIAERAPDA